MKLPAVAIAASFVCGIVLGLSKALAHAGGSRSFLLGCSLLASLSILTGVVLLRFNCATVSGEVSLVAWVALGVLSASIAQQPLPPDHVVRLVDSGQLDLRSPLRWHGTLRDEPASLPWGFGYEIELTGVDYHGATAPVRGGLRLSFTPHTVEQKLPALHVGDGIAVLAQAKRPQFFRDEGAFDRRAYLATQNIDLTAALRAPELIERISVAPLAPGIFIARARRRMRDEVDTLFGARPEVAGVLRAMLLGDRTFVDRDEATDFQKTDVFHVLVVAGLHVGALAALLFWLARKLRLSPAGLHFLY